MTAATIESVYRHSQLNARAIGAIGRLLVDKGVITEDELHALLATVLTTENP